MRPAGVASCDDELKPDGAVAFVDDEDPGADDLDAADEDEPESEGWPTPPMASRPAPPRCPAQRLTPDPADIPGISHAGSLSPDPRRHDAVLLCGEIYAAVTWCWRQFPRFE